MRARIQRQLGRLQRPDYIQSLEVVGVDCGGVAPTLRNLRALPQPGAAIWPQLLFDMRYQGGLGGGQGGWGGILIIQYILEDSAISPYI